MDYWDANFVEASSASTLFSAGTDSPIRIEATAPGDTPDNHYRGTVADLLYMGDVTMYRVATPGGMRVEALLANSQSGRAKFFEVGDAVEMSWSVEAGHFIEE